MCTPQRQHQHSMTGRPHNAIDAIARMCVAFPSHYDPIQLSINRDAVSHLDPVYGFSGSGGADEAPVEGGGTWK